MSEYPSPAQLALVYAHAADAYPVECCGFIRASDVRRCVNVLDELHRARPAEYRTAATGYAFGVADLRELSDSFDSDDPVRVVYHSHPDVGAYFSAEDARYAVFEGQPVHPVDHLVVDATAEGVRGARLFRFDPAIGAYAAAATYDAPHPAVLP
ncbi:Mov34/MPN/PAD-1 family protein [Pilimelia anulata]|nr:Mov34/MPN/PAD-1 family protein [Pilimelia anulata]